MMMSPGGEYPLHEKFTLSRFSEIVNELKISAARRIMGKIDVKNMELYYSSFHALKNINLEIPEKKITAFIGPSGCGKSTLLKSLNRMNDLVEGCKITGDICLDGEDLWGY